MKRIGCFLALLVCTGLYSMERRVAANQLRQALDEYDRAVDAIEAEAVQNLVNIVLPPSVPANAPVLQPAIEADPVQDQESTAVWTLKKIVAPFAIAGGATAVIIMLIRSMTK